MFAFFFKVEVKGQTCSSADAIYPKDIFFLVIAAVFS